MKDKIILASSSPRRRELLSAAGFKFYVEPAEVNEKEVLLKYDKKLSCRDTVICLAKAKACEVYQRFSGNWVIGSDTIVTLNERIFGKPSSREEALEMIELLSGREHLVLSGICLIAPDGRCRCEVEETAVKFRALTGEEIVSYVNMGESMDKAGAYAIQGFGSLLCEKLSGDYYNVVGLPLVLLSKMMADFGYSLSDQWRKYDE